jgi:hypothetical protein
MRLHFGLTFNRLAVLGSITFRTSRTSCVSDEPTWPCLMMKDFGTPSTVVDDVAELPFKCVLFLRLRAIREIRFQLYLCARQLPNNLNFHESLGVLSRPVYPIGHPSPVQAAIIPLVALKANRIHLSSQS